MMPSALTRRAVLGTVGITIVTFSAGCTQGQQPRDDRSPAASSPEASPASAAPSYGIETPVTGECEPIEPPMPTSTKELEPVEYPDYPDGLTVESAKSFASAYERAYWHNWVVVTDWMAGTDEVSFEGGGVPDWAVDEHRQGYIVGVNGELQTADVHSPPDRTPGTESATPVPYLDQPFSAWYYLTAEVALRKEREGDFPVGRQPDPDLTGADVIYCG